MVALEWAWLPPANNSSAPEFATEKLCCCIATDGSVVMWLLAGNSMGAGGSVTTVCNGKVGVADTPP